MSDVPTLIEMLQSGVHFGHVKGRWHPKMEKYIFTTRGGVHIINLEETAKKLHEAAEYVQTIGQKGGIVLFVGTKKQAAALVEKAAQECAMPYVTKRWLGGTLTNFSVIQKLIQHYKMLKTTLGSDERARYTKKEQLLMERKVAKMDVTVGGLVGLDRKPDAIILVDVRRERTAVREALSTRTPMVAMTDTNTNPEKISYPIPANDDAVRSIEMILNVLKSAYLEGKAQARALEPHENHPSETVISPSVI